MALPITEGRTFKNSVLTPQTVLQICKMHSNIQQIRSDPVREILHGSLA